MENRKRKRVKEREGEGKRAEGCNAWEVSQGGELEEEEEEEEEGPPPSSVLVSLSINSFHFIENCIGNRVCE